MGIKNATVKYLNYFFIKRGASSYTAPNNYSVIARIENDIKFSRTTTTLITSGCPGSVNIFDELVWGIYLFINVIRDKHILFLPNQRQTQRLKLAREIRKVQLLTVVTVQVKDPDAVVTSVGDEDVTVTPGNSHAPRLS